MIDPAELTPSVRAKLAELFQRAVLVEHPMGTYLASIICNGRDSRAICGVLAKFDALPENFHDREHVIEVGSRTGGSIFFMLGNPAVLDEFKGNFGAVRTITQDDLDRNGQFFGSLAGKPDEKISADLKIKGYLMERLNDLKVTPGAARLN